MTTQFQSHPSTATCRSLSSPNRQPTRAAASTKRRSNELAAASAAKASSRPCLCGPSAEHSFEIVAGARRYRAAQMAEAATVPVRIVELTDAQALEAQLVENLQRRDVHPLEEAQGFARACCT